MLRLESEMETETVSASELSSLLGVSKKTVAGWATAGVVKRTKHCEYDLRESIRGFARHMRDRGPAGDATAVAVVASHRATLLKIQAERAQFAFEQERELWVTVADVEAHWCATLRAVRAGCLAIPTRIASRVPGVTREMAYEIDQEVRAALTEMATAGYPFPGSPEDMAAKKGEAA
jgi:phage terminase Nu1 subunit (DNA packaging protein)